MAPSLMVAIPGADNLGAEAPAYNVRLSRSGKPYIIWSKSASGTPASGLNTSRAETPASTSDRIFPGTTNTRASLPVPPTYTRRVDQPASTAVSSSTNRLQTGFGRTAEAGRGQARQSTDGGNAASALHRGVFESKSLDDESAGKRGSSTSLHNEHLLTNAITRGHENDRAESLQQSAQSVDSTMILVPRESSSHLACGPRVSEPLVSLDLRSNALPGSQEGAITAGQSVQQIGTERTSKQQTDFADGTQENLVCDICINKHLVEDKREQQRREREERQRLAAEASLRAERVSAEWETRMVEERARVIEKAKAERDQYQLQKQQARDEYVASPRFEPQGPAGMVFKGSTSRTAAEKEHARYKEELDQQVASRQRFAAEEAARAHPLGTVPVPLTTSQLDLDSFVEAKKESYSDALTKQVLEKKALREAEKGAAHPLGNTRMRVISNTPTRQAELSNQAAWREQLAEQRREKERLDQLNAESLHPLGEVPSSPPFAAVDFDKARADHKAALRAALDRQVSEKKTLKESGRSAPHPLGETILAKAEATVDAETALLQQKAAYRKLLDEQVAQKEAWKRLTSTGAHPLGNEPAWGHIDKAQALNDYEHYVQNKSKSYQETLAAQIAERQKDKQKKLLQEQLVREEQITQDRRQAQRAKEEEVAKSYAQKMAMRESWLKEIQQKDERKRQERLARTQLASQARELASSNTQYTASPYEIYKREQAEALKRSLESQIAEKKTQKQLERRESRARYQAWCGDDSANVSATTQALAKGASSGLAGGNGGYLGNYLKCVECKRTVPAKSLAPWRGAARAGVVTR